MVVIAGNGKITGNGNFPHKQEYMLLLPCRVVDSGPAHD